MDDGQEQDQYEERLKEVFNSFDTSGCGSLSPDELSDLCQSLHLDDAAPVLLHALLQNQDHLTARVDFDQFKNALILVLSSTFESPPAEEEPVQRPESPEIQPKFVKGSKRYGRRSTPEMIEPVSSLSEFTSVNPAEGEYAEDNYDSAVPRKRERWNAQESPVEFEAEGQMHLWNPDEPSTPRTSAVPPSVCSDERLREACEELAISLDRCADHSELLVLCEHLGLEIKEEELLSLTCDGVLNVQEFVSRVVNHNKPPTPSASTPYRQLKRHHSTQPFDEVGRRIATPSALSSTIGPRLFSTLDDGTGFTPVEYILDAWSDEGIENSSEILQALNFDVDGKVSLSDLTMALENELLVTKNGIHQAALASFKAEIRHLLECVDKEFREKEKIRSDLEKAEKLKNQLATEVDEHHSAIEQTNNLKLRKLEQEHKEKLTTVRSELVKEMERIQQQAGLQREELETEMERIREDESFLRDHLSISVKENRRLEMELLDSTEKLLDAQSQITKLQTTVDNIMKEKFGDLDPGSADFFVQEERIKQLRCGYEAQCRELQDRIDELQSELQDFHSLGRVHNQSCNKTLSEELESKSPGMESDPGIGSEDVQPFSLSLEAEMMLERLKEQHFREVGELRSQLESKNSEFDQMVENQRTNHVDQKAVLFLQHQQEVQALRDEMACVQTQRQELQNQLEQAELEQRRLDQKRVKERAEQEEEVGDLRQQLLEAHTLSSDLEEQLKDLEAQLAQTEGSRHSQVEELKKQHDMEIKKLGEKHVELSRAKLEEVTNSHQEERAKLEGRFLEDIEEVKQTHEMQLKIKLQEAKLRFEEQQKELMLRLTEQWDTERSQVHEQKESLQEERLKLVRVQEEQVRKLEEQWEVERAQLQRQHEDTVLERIIQERSDLEEEFQHREKDLQDEWEKERLRLEEDYESLLDFRVNEEREKFESEKEEVEKRLEALRAEEGVRLEERHRDVVKELTFKHSEEKEMLSRMLDKLREDIALERREIQVSFTQRLKEVKERFSADQESAAEHFQLTILNVEQRHQRELKMLSESHVGQKLNMEAQIQKAAEQNQVMEQEQESTSQKWKKQRCELEKIHGEEMEKLMVKNIDLQDELDRVIGQPWTKEVGLSRQLKDLHHQLQKNLDMKGEVLTKTELNMSNRKQPEEQMLEDNLEKHKEEPELELDQHKEEPELELDQVFTSTDKVGRPVQGESEEPTRRSLSSDDPDPSDQDLCCYSASVFDQEVDVETTSDRPGSLRDVDNECVDPEGDCEPLPAKINAESVVSAPVHSEHEGEDAEDPSRQALNLTAAEENALLHEKICLLRQKSDILENLLAFQSEKIKTSHQVLEENYSLKVKLLLLMEHVKELEMKALKMTDVQIRYEDCMCENAKLTEQNLELEQRVWSLETNTGIFHNIQDDRFSPVVDVQLAKLLGELEEQDEVLTGLDLNTGWPETPSEEDLLDLISQLEPKLLPSCDVEDSSDEFGKFGRAITDLQEKWQRLNEAAEVQRAESCSLAEENLRFRQKIDALKDEDLKSAQEELTQSAEHLKIERSSAQRAAENFQKQITELRLRSAQLENENEKLSEENLHIISDMEDLRQQLGELTEEKERREALPAEDKTQLAACVTSLEAELTKALEDTAQLEERNLQLSQQLNGLMEKMISMENDLSHLLEERSTLEQESQGLRDQLAKAQERVKTVDETSHAVNHQSARLKADVRALQKERDSLKHDAAILHKRLQNANDKNRVLEMSVHSSGLQSHSKKLARLMEQEQVLLRQENDRLQAEVRIVKGDLLQSKEKVRQLDSTILSLKQQKQPSQSSLLKVLEQENAALKQELEAHKEQNKSCEAAPGQTPSVESLQQENEALREQLTRLSSQLLESFQAHLVGLLPPSPLRLPRGPHRAEDLDNMQDERERKMRNMEERMREVELSLHNVKLLLKEKVIQLKEQLNKNGKADVLIQDLYVENSQLLKALEITEQRQKLSEKRNFLLEEKISSLNKIVRDLNPTTLASLPYHYKCSS